MLTTFLLASSVITLMPGPSMILVIMNTIDGGLNKGFQSILGVVCADAILLGVILSGVGTLVASSAIIFNMIKWCGAFYLIYLGIGILRSLSAQNELNASSLASPFSSAINMTLLNPKIIIFLIAFFPQFIDAQKPMVQQMSLLCVLFLLVVFVILLLYALCALKLTNVFNTKKGMRMIKIVTAISLMGCGLIAVPF